MKNLKKGLAVAMSLAMIATVVPTMKVDATNYCTLAQNKAYDKVLGALEDAGLEIDTMKLTDVVDEMTDDDGTDDVTVEKFLTTYKIETVDPDGADLTAKQAIEDYADCNIRPSDEVADKLVGFVVGVKANETNIATLETKFALDDDVLVDGSTQGDDGAWIDEIPSGDYDAAKTLYADLISDDFEMYLGNVSDLHAAVYNSYFSDLETVLDEYKSDNFDTVVDKYVTELTTQIEGAVTGLTIADFLKDGKIEYSKLTSVEKIVEKIEEDKITELKSISKYIDMETEDDVAEIMEALDVAIDGMKEAKDLMNARNTTTVAFNKINKSEVSALLKLEVKDAAADKPAVTFDDLLNAVSTTKLGTIAEYYNEVTSMFYELTVKERANGTYTASLVATDLANYLSAAEVTKVEGVFKALAKVIDKDEPTTYLDEVINKADEIANALKAITTDIKGITVKNLNSANAAKVVAAKDALEVLNDNAGSLTSAQARTVKTAEKNIDILYTYMLFNGIVAETNDGWVDLGNGNWDYYKDGKAVTAWVAAGTNWYFVKDGHMLRNTWVAQDSTGAIWYYVDNAGKMVVNTTIDGYAINANGEWHKK